MARELSLEDPLPPEYWESLGMEDAQAKPSDPFSAPPPGAGENPFEGHGGPSGRSRYEAPWLRTEGGIDFINVFIGDVPDSNDREVLIFLYEVVEGRYNVGYSRPRTTKGGDWYHRDVPYEEAKRLAEEQAMAMSVDAGAAADWRMDFPSPGQISFARRLGIKVDPDNDSKGDVSNKINTVLGSRILDPTFGPRSES